MNNNLACQEAPREELIGGQPVAMSPRPSVDHHQVSLNIANIFSRYLKGKTCRPFGDGVDLYLTDQDWFIPDGMVVCDRDKIKHDGVHGAPDLVVEVLSPGTVQNDRGHKKDVYQRCGVPEYWIVSPNEKTVEQYLLEDGQYKLNAAYSIHPDFMLARMSAEERAALVTAFRCSLFDDLVIQMEDIFDRVT